MARPSVELAIANMLIYCCSVSACTWCGYTTPQTLLCIQMWLFSYVKVLILCPSWSSLIYSNQCSNLKPQVEAKLITSGIHFTGRFGNHCQYMQTHVINFDSRQMQWSLLCLLLCLSQLRVFVSEMDNCDTNINITESFSNHSFGLGYKRPRGNQSCP